MPEMTPPSVPAAPSRDVESPGEVPSATETTSRPVMELVEADLLVEDVSIDGMCGVY